MLGDRVAEVRQVEVSEGDAGQRLDNLLLRELKGVPRSHVYRLLRRGEVRVNGKRAKPETRLTAGDRVRIPPVRQEASPPGQAEPSGRVVAGIEARVIHEDERLIVIDKPSGLAVHGGSGLAFGVIEALRAARPGSRLELAHRLDRDTSGVLLVAKGGVALRHLHALLREGQVAKRYLALVKGRWRLGKKRLDLPLATSHRQGGERTVRVHADGKPSVSVFDPLERLGELATLMRVDLETGRTHQIRVHAAYSGHPVAGADKYGDRDFNQRLRELGLRRLFLHAHRLEFVWPDTGQRCEWTSPLPAELESVLERLR
ncbi:MAG: RluA family pseudouridine synthase [Steroidobacteraceae bacterium]